MMVSENMVKVGGVMACDGEKGVESMQMDKEEELLQQQPNQQQPQLPGAADPDLWPPQWQQVLMRARAIGKLEAMIFRFLFGGAEQQQGRLRLESANRREARAIASRRAIGSEKALAPVGPSASSGVGGRRRLVGALPVRGEHAYFVREKR